MKQIKLFFYFIIAIVIVVISDVVEIAINVFMIPKRAHDAALEMYNEVEEAQRSKWDNFFDDKE